MDLTEFFILKSSPKMITVYSLTSLSPDIVSSSTSFSASPSSSSSSSPPPVPPSEELLLLE